MSPARKGISAGDEWIQVEAEKLKETIADLQLKGYGCLAFITCVDHLATPVTPAPPARFELLYELRHMDHAKRLRVRAFVDGDPPKVASVTGLLHNANWDEREVFDLFGIVFEGHPDLRRILMPDDWVGHPLRRDYPVGGEAVEFSDDHIAWQTAPPEA